MNSGECFYRQMGVMEGPCVEFGPQALSPLEDVEYSRQDTGFGWDQALTMDRQPVDTYVQRTYAAAMPPGIAVAADSVYLNLERNQGNAADEVTPQFRFSGLGLRFDSPLALIEWAPNTEVIHAGGYTSQVREDMLPQTAKQGIDPGYFGVIDTQELLNEAVARTRRAMYGR